MSTPEPGWYPDPTTPGSLRYFDGSTWTSQTMAPDAPVAHERVATEQLDPPPAGVVDEAPARARRRPRGWIPWAAGAAVVVVAAAAVGIVTLVRANSPVAVPETVGMTVAEAADALTAEGLLHAEHNSLGGDEVEDDWKVTKSTPKGEVEPGSTIEIWAESVLTTAAKRCGETDTVIDDGRALSLDTGYNNSNIDPVVCVLMALDVPDVVVDHMDSTRALDGRQTETWDGLSAEWTYHPDSGMDLLVRLAD